MIYNSENLSIYYKVKSRKNWCVPTVTEQLVQDLFNKITTMMK